MRLNYSLIANTTAGYTLNLQSDTWSKRDLIIPTSPPRFITSTSTYALHASTSLKQHHSSLPALWLLQFGDTKLNHIQCRDLSKLSLVPISSTSAWIDVSLNAEQFSPPMLKDAAVASSAGCLVLQGGRHIIGMGAVPVSDIYVMNTGTSWLCMLQRTHDE